MKNYDIKNKVKEAMSLANHFDDNEAKRAVKDKFHELYILMDRLTKISIIDETIHENGTRTYVVEDDEEYSLIYNDHVLLKTFSVEECLSAYEASLELMTVCRKGAKL